MIVIRLTRVGKRKQPTYRLVVQEKHRDPWGKAFEIVGHYNPRSTPKTVVLKEERIKEWLAKGAQPSPTVHNLLVNAKVIAAGKQRVTPMSKGEVPEASKTEEKKTEAAPAQKEKPAPTPEAPEEKPEEKKEEAPAEEAKDAK